MTITGTRKSTNKLVDAFVERLNAGSRERLLRAEVPEALRAGEADEYDYCDWRISPCGAGTWIADLEEKLPGRLPPSYRSLVERYMFPAFEVGDVLLFANTGDDAWLELSTWVFKDQGLSGVLLRDGFVQFGRYQDRYDPVCFDLSRRRGGGECPVVHLDHEEALIGGRTTVVATIADSFLSLIA